MSPMDISLSNLPCHQSTFQCPPWTMSLVDITMGALLGEVDCVPSLSRVDIIMALVDIAKLVAVIKLGSLLMSTCGYLIT